MANSLYFKANNRRYTISLYDMMHPKPVDNRTGEEIAMDVIKNAGLKPKGD